VRENLDYVVWFTLVWSGVVIAMVAIVVGIFLFVRSQSRTEQVRSQKSQATSHKSDS
jgi:type II secretory pathway pseudopilin PulG